jgi:hypothetical protein
MRRSKESQKAHLLGELSSSSATKKVIATRGTKIFIDDNKRPKVKKSSISILPLMGIWGFLSLLLWFIFFKSIYSLIFIEVIGTLIIYFFSSKILKNENYELIKEIKQKKTLVELVDEHRQLFNDEITVIVEDIVSNISYLQGFSEQKLLDMEQQHYLESCEEKHLVDLFTYLRSSHKDHLGENQKGVLEQLNGINEKLKRIILTVQKSIETEIKVKAVFNKDY